LIVDKTFAEMYVINIGKVKKISCNARCQQENSIPRFGHPPAFIVGQEARIVSKSIPRVTLSVFRKKGELLDEIEEVSGKVLRHSWTPRILTRHQYEIAPGTGYPQEYTDRGVRNRFLASPAITEASDHEMAEADSVNSSRPCGGEKWGTATGTESLEDQEK
jgi:hypothetical protein